MKTKLSFVSVTVALLLWASASFAQVFTLPTLDPSQTGPIFNTLAADWAFRPVQPASDMGLWGISVGVSGTDTSNSQISGIVPGTSALYAADLSGTVQIPFGIAVEVGFLPGLSMSNTTESQYGGDVKWTLTRDFLDFLPFDVAVRGMFTHVNLGYSQSVTGGSANITYTGNMTGGMLSVSKDLFIINPYLGYGFIQQSSTLASDNVSLFGSNFPAGTSSTSGSSSSGWLQLGLQFKLGIITLAAEYDDMFNVASYSGRFAFAL